MALRVSWEPTGDPVLDRLGQRFVERVACNARGGSYARRQVKFKMYVNFLEFLAEHFGPDDLRNIQPRHVAAFIRHLRDQGRSWDRILAYLSVIRWWHEQIYWRKYELPENKILFELEANIDDKEFCAAIKDRSRRKKLRRAVQKPCSPVGKSLA